uniref:Small integral membrane protein 31 n=1 Tax=Gopherus agassizii TaxID=38772 RepID=A0A452H1P4_9SAUR
MELPFTNLETAFILLAFVIFSSFILVSIYSDPDENKAEHIHSLRLHLLPRRQTCEKSTVSNRVHAINLLLEGVL